MSKWTDQASPIRSGEELDMASLESYLREAMPQAQGELVIEQFPRGFSNLTYLLRLGEQQLVLRRPPFGANIKSAHDMSREFRILDRLHAVYAKAPRPYLYCENEAVIGAPFYVMERVQGIILRPVMPPEMRPNPNTMRGIADALADTLAELHAIDYTAAGLADLGKPEGYVQRQVEGWSRRYQRAKTDEIPGLEQAAVWLSEHRPADGQPALIHNDFKYDNVVLNPADWNEITAILDWEMATLGDPLMDLGTSIGYWINEDDPPLMKGLNLSPTTLSGNPSRGEFAQRYAAQSGRDISNLVYYFVFGVFKIAVIIQQIYARYKQGHTKDPRFAGLIEGVKGCGVVAQQAIQKNQVDGLF